MISREDFIFTIGFDGEVAIVDGRSKRSYGKLSTIELAEKGLFKAAVCSAVFEKDEEALRMIMESYNRRAHQAVTSPEQLMRLFGVTEVPEAIRRVMVC
jgi:hypothetical protein